MRQKEKGLEKVQILIDPTNGQNCLESLEKNLIGPEMIILHWQMPL